MSNTLPKINLTSYKSLQDAINFIVSITDKQFIDTVKKEGVKVGGYFKNYHKVKYDLTADIVINNNIYTLDYVVFYPGSELVSLGFRGFRMENGEKIYYYQ